MVIGDLEVLDCDTFVGEKSKEFNEIGFIEFWSAVKFFGEAGLSSEDLQELL